MCPAHQTNFVLRAALVPVFLAFLVEGGQPVMASADQSPADQLISLNTSFMQAFVSTFPGRIDSFNFFVIDPMSQAISLSENNSGDAEHLANFVPMSSHFFAPSSRTVYSDYRTVLSNAHRLPLPETPEVHDALAKLYQRQKPGVILRSSTAPLKVSPLCFDYLIANERILSVFDSRNAQIRSGSNIVVDAVIGLGSKNEIRDALESVAEDDVRRSFWVNAYGEASALSNDQDAEAATLLEPTRDKWSHDSSWTWITVPVAGLPANSLKMEILTVAIERPWLAFDLFDRHDWSFDDVSDRYKAVGIGEMSRYDSEVGAKVLPAMPVGLVFVRNIIFDGDSGSFEVVSRMSGAMASDHKASAIFLGAICRRIVDQPVAPGRYGGKTQ